jgi:FkbM family methyltransferase
MDIIKNDTKGSGIFIQVGAGAGDLDTRANCRDGFTEFIKSLPRSRVKKIILIEPNPANLHLLRECWKNYPEVIIYELAIVPKDITTETITFYYCKKDFPHYQVASINKSHVEKHYPNQSIDSMNVQTISVKQFINDIIGNDTIELLSLDIEGIDAEILLELPLSNLKIKYLSMEYIHLMDKEESVYNYLSSNNFEFLGSGVDYQGFDKLYRNNSI